MSIDTVAKRYAKGLIKTISNEEEYQKIKSELGDLIELFKKEPKFHAGMMTPLFSHEQKNELVDSLLTSGFSHQTGSFVRLLIQANRLPALEAIFKSLDDIWLEMNQIEKYTVYSVKPLSQEQYSRLKNKLEKVVNRKVSLGTCLDSSLIAGIKLQRGSVFYDFSIAGNLAKLRNTLIEEN